MAGLQPLRPLVVFVTDGRPTRGYWPPTHAALTDPGWEGAADILAFGFGEASGHTIRRIGTAGAYPPPAGQPRTGVDPARPRGRTGPPGLVAPVMSFVLDVLGHPPTAVAAPSVSPLPDALPDALPEAGTDAWPFLRELTR
jgi:hypothetical protein